MRRRFLRLDFLPLGSFSQPRLVPLVPQALWPRCRRDGNHIQVRDLNFDQLLQKAYSDFGNPIFSLLWVIVHAYVITQIVDDDDLKVQR